MLETLGFKTIKMRFVKAEDTERTRQYQAKAVLKNISDAIHEAVFPFFKNESFLKLVKEVADAQEEVKENDGLLHAILDKLYQTKLKKLRIQLLSALVAHNFFHFIKVSNSFVFHTFFSFQFRIGILAINLFKI